MAWSQFYGEVKGRARTAAARSGTDDSGLRVFAASKTGAFVIHMVREQGHNAFAVRVVPWGDSNFQEILLCTGRFVEGDNSPVLRLDNKLVRSHIETEAYRSMTEDT